MDELNTSLFIQNDLDFNNVDLSDIVDSEEIVNIDLDEVDEKAAGDADSVIKNIVDIYSNEEFMNKNPKLRTRIQTELESLRLLIKMRRSDEISHDLIIKAISQKPSNASLYKALTEVQKTILSVTTKIEDVIKGLSGILKNYQLELNFAEDDNEEDNKEDDSSSNSNTHRGTKDFIEKMLKEKETD